MNPKRVLLTLLVALVGAGAAACSSKCGPSNCVGCCDATGACQTSANAHCGLTGNACSACLGSQACQLGACVTPGGSGGSGGSGSGSGSGSSSSGGSSGTSSGNACTRYLGCVYQVDPNNAAVAQSAYGPTGTCWSTTSADACLQGCTSGLQGLHALHPSVSACALCSTDADCGGSRPACDTAAGECVACTTDAQCQGALPACDPGTHTCVACNDGSQCPSNACLSNHTCCVPQACADILLASSRGASCGSYNDGCGTTIDCGSCDSTHYCDSATGSCQPITSTFDCFSNGSVGSPPLCRSNCACQKNTQYCFAYFNGPGGSFAECQSMPTACQSNPTCACLAAQGVVDADAGYSCSEGSGPNGAGATYVSYAVP